MKPFFTLLLCCFFSVFSFAQNEINLNQGSIEQKKYHTTINYEKTKSKIFVDVVIEGKTYKFLLDTGAPFAVSQKLYNELKLSIVGKVEVLDASGKSGEMIITSVPKLQMGELTFLNTPGILFTEATNQIFDCLDIDGIIGSNMLRNSVIQFDDRNNKIIVTNDAGKLDLKKIPYQKLTLTQTQSNPFIQIMLKKGNQEATDNILFDTGADGFYEMSVQAYYFLKDRVDVVNTIAESEGSFTWGLHGMTDKEHQFVLEIPQLSINGNILKKVQVTTTSSNESRMGAEILSHAKVTLDYKKKRFYYEPYEAVDTLSQQIWAISPTLQNNKMVVGIIWDKQLESKVNIGDEILNFNGIDYQSMEFCDLVRSENKFSDKKAIIKFKDVHTGAVKTLEINRL